MTVCSFSTFGLFKAKNNHLLFISTPSSHSHTHHPTMILTDKDLQLLSSMQAASQSAGIDSASDHISLISDRVGSGKDLNDLKIGECDSCSTSKSRVDSTRLIFSFFNSSTSSTLLPLPSLLCNSKYSSHSFYSFHFHLQNSTAPPFSAGCAATKPPDFTTAFTAVRDAKYV